MPDPASSFMVGNAPNGANYAAPLLNFAPIAQAPQDIFQGQQRARTTALQNAFPNGLPTDPVTGQPDINAVTNTLTKLGGAEYASQMLPLLLQSRMGQQGAQAVENSSLPGTGQQQPAGTANVPSASGPANIRGSQNAPVQQPSLSSAGADDQGSDTVRSVATETFGGRDVSALIPRFAKALGIGPDDPLTPEQVSQARGLMTRTASAASGAQSDVTGGGAPVTPLSGTSGAPSVAPNAGPEQASPSTGIVPQQTAQAAPQNAPAGNAAPSVPGVPPGYDPTAFGNAMLQRATALRAQAASVASFPAGANQAKVMQEQAQMLEARAKQIFDFMGTAQQPTNEQKNVATGADTKTAVNQAEAKRSSEVYSGIQGAANQYETALKPYLDLSRSILNDPRVYTGTGGNLSLDLNRVKSLFGNQNAAALQEALQKVTASSVLAQINQQKNELMQSGGPGSSGRIFQSQVELVEKAAPQLSTTSAGNRFLVEVAGRMGDLSSTVRDMAAQYLNSKQQAGQAPVLDAKFDQQVASYLKSHPIFSKEELSNPLLLAAPTAPENLKTTHDRVAWGNGIGLKPGDPFRVNGRYQYWHGGQAAQQ